MLSVKRQAPATELQASKRPQRLIPVGKSLGHCFPDIARQLQDKSLDPFDISAGSGLKYSWVCNKAPICPNCSTPHVWDDTVSHRTNGKRGCPWCSNHGNVVCRCKSLGYKYPTVATQLNDKSINAFQISANCNKKYTWVCSTVPNGRCQECGTQHIWDAPVYSRTSGQRGCPLCSNCGPSSKVCKCKSLGFKFPELIPEVNDKSLDVYGVSAKSNKIIEWICSNKTNGLCECGTTHVWKTAIATRTERKSACPWCTKVGSHGYVCRCNSVGYLHPELISQFVDKTVNPFAVSSHSGVKYKWVCNKFQDGKCDECGTLHEWEATVDHRVQGNGCPFCSSTSLCRCRSLGYKFPKIACELQDKNINPFEVPFGSGQITTWVCSSTNNGVCGNCGTLHVWKTSVNNRTSGRGCPFCSGCGVNGQLCKCRSLGFKYPDIAKELQDTVDPFTIPFATNVRYLWKCSNVTDGTCPCGTIHTWTASVNHRTSGAGCPWYSSKGPSSRVCRCKSLGYLYPDICNELIDQDPFSIPAHSNLLCTWKCTKGHTWKSSVGNRTGTYRRNCPQCSFNKAEAKLLTIVESHSLITSHSKHTISCYDIYSQKNRQLIPDAIVELTSGHKISIELDGPQHFESVYWYDAENCSDLHDQLVGIWSLA